VPAGELRAHAFAKAKALAGKPKEALAASRRMLRGEPKELLATMDAEGLEFAKRLAMPEARAAFLAFTSKKRQG
jgi:hypothetical protein